MKIIKGFVTIESYVDNATNTTAPLGELSTWSRSYKKDKGFYGSTTYPSLSLTTFTNIDVTTGVGILTTLEVDAILKVAKAAIDYNNTHIRPFAPVDFANFLLADSPTEITSVEIGDFVDNGQVALPEWISWTNPTTNDSVRIWLSDYAFRTQYDEYEIVVIPPLPTLNDFFGPYNDVVALIDGVVTQDLVERMEVVKGQYPETYFRIMNFDFVNVNNIVESTTTEWGIIIYGSAGDNLDLIKDAIQEHLISNSNHSRNAWSNIFPDIFKRTEFLIIPRWDKVSVPNQTTLSALYGNMLNPVEVIDFLETNLIAYPRVWLENNTNIVPYDFKAIVLTIVTGMDNRLDSSNLPALFPDYIPVSTSSPDFSRMTERTKEWSFLLHQALVAAETADNYTPLVFPLRKIDRLGDTYVTFMYDNVNYLVSARLNTLFQN